MLYEVITLTPGQPIDPNYPGSERITKLQGQGRTWFAMQSYNFV